AFVKRPERLLERAARSLRPGGRMVVHEYVDYRAWRLSPRRAEFEAFVDEVVESWRASGGEPDVGLDLPRWLGALGFELETLEPLVDVARREDYVWQWPSAFVEGGIQRLVDLGRIGAERGRAMARAH